MSNHRRKQREILEELAHEAMIDRGFQPDFSDEIERELEAIIGPAKPSAESLREMGATLWCSIDNDDSKDLDQLTAGERIDDERVRILIAIADVDALVPKDSAIDQRARHNTTSIYTAGKVFSMLPEKLSTDLTSLNPGVDRLAVVTEMEVNDQGEITRSSIFRAVVHNHAKLAYNAVDAWLDGREPMPDALERVPTLDDSIRLQDRVAQTLRAVRIQEGALDLETIEARAVMSDGAIVDLKKEERNQAKDLIADFMIATNGVTARFLRDRGMPSLRRVVREPRRWDRIVAIAEQLGEGLPGSPDSLALEEFLARRRKADPVRYPDLSLSIIKLLGSGEYVVEIPGAAPVGHFGLAVRDYTHSTAPNRRYPDLITQRLVKAALAGKPSPYTIDELESLAEHCTEQEDESNKIERRMAKSAAAMLLHPRIGERFDAIVTGASEKGTWVRIFHPPVEGKVVHGFEGLDVGDRVRVKLIDTDVERGFIDFVRTRK